jgi:hypothetical protein
MTSSPLFRRILLAGCLLVAAASAGKSLADAETKQFWVDYNPTWVLSPKTFLYGDVGYRTETGTADWNRLVIRPAVSRSHKHVILRGGLGNFFTFSDEIQNRWELRPFQGVYWVWPRSKVLLDHYLRLEERFDFNTVDWSSEISLRARYRLRLRYKFFESRPDRFWRAHGSGEFFLKLAGTEGLQRDQFRIALGVERSFNSRMRWRIEGIWRQADASFLPDSDPDEFYFRIRFYQNF